MKNTRIVGSLLLPGRRRVVPYSIQTLKRVKPKVFRDDLTTLFDLLRQKKIEPLIARTFLSLRRDKRTSCSGAAG